MTVAAMSTSSPSTGQGHLVAEGIRKQFTGVVAVDDLTLEVRPGEIVGLIGPNGAGKTTFFDCVTGFSALNGGRVRLDGVDVTTWSPTARARAGMARTFQQAKMFRHLSVRENLLLGRHRHYRASSVQAALQTPRARAAERAAATSVERVAERCHLAGVLDAPVAALPYGAQRMVEVARALASEPAILLLDEPAAGMDSAESASFGELLREVSDETGSILLIEHDVPLVLTICHRIYVLDFGRLIASGTPEAIRADERVREAYFGSMAGAGGG